MLFRPLRETAALVVVVGVVVTVLFLRPFGVTAVRALRRAEDAVLDEALPGPAPFPTAIAATTTRGLRVVAMHRRKRCPLLRWEVAVSGTTVGLRLLVANRTLRTDPFQTETPRLRVAVAIGIPAMPILHHKRPRSTVNLP